MFPVYDIDYVVNNWGHIKGRHQLYAFFLFNHEHNNLGSYVAENFLKFDSISNKILLFLISKPPVKWESSIANRYYWEEFRRLTKNKDLSDEEENIYRVADYFNISYDRMPCLIMFNDINIGDYAVVNFSKVDPSIYESFFDCLFTEANKLSEDRLANNNMQFRASMFAAILNRKLFKFNCEVFSQSHPNQPLRQILESINQVGVDLNQHEQNEYKRFSIINNELNQIKLFLERFNKQVTDHRINFAEQMQEIALDSSDKTQREEKVKEFHETIDNELSDNLKEIKSILKKRENNFESIYNLPAEHIEIFHSETCSFLGTSFYLYKYIRNEKLSDMDYTICAVGLWKALELELNLLFIDPLRLKLKIMNDNKPFFLQKPLANSEKISIPGQRKGDKAIILSKIDKNNGCLKGLMLGELADILEGGNHNQLGDIIKKHPLLSQYLNDIIGSETQQKGIYTGLPTEIRIVANKYRNKHAHIRKMGKNIFRDFNKFMLLQKPALLMKILNYKKIILS
jgi:hypothetical protein